MKKFILLIRGEERFAQLSPAEIEATVNRYRAWSKKLTEEGRLVDAEGLSSDRRILTGSSDGLITDGPYPETKEMIGGYFIFNASGLEEATEIVKECPALGYGGSVELRPVMDYS